MASGRAPDRGARSGRLGEHLVDLGGAAHVQGEGDPAPTAHVVDGAVGCKVASPPQPDHHAAGLEEDDVTIGRLALPPELLVEGARDRAVSATPRVTREMRWSM